jgi:hypothetical protein
MSPELPRKNIILDELTTKFELITQDAKFRECENRELDQKVNQLISFLRQAFSAHSDFFEQHRTSKGPNLDSIRAKYGAYVKPDATLPQRKELIGLWSLIGHLSHKINLDEIFSANPEIEQMIDEIGLSVVLASEAIDVAKMKKKQARKSPPIDLNALRVRVRSKLKS